jgi:hypothetical protein
LERFRERTGVAGVILHEQNSNQLRLQMPRPACDSTQMRPPLRSPARWQMARQAPVPGIVSRRSRFADPKRTF